MIKSTYTLHASVAMVTVKGESKSARVSLTEKQSAKYLEGSLSHDNVVDKLTAKVLKAFEAVGDFELAREVEELLVEALDQKAKVVSRNEVPLINYVWGTVRDYARIDAIAGFKQKVVNVYTLDEDLFD